MTFPREKHIMDVETGGFPHHHMSGGTRMNNDENARGQAGLPVGALLRRPAVLVRHHVMNRLREEGFDDILPAHLGVFQHPGPDGVRPGVLAARTQASKQAMNHLLHQLEHSGYLHRESHLGDRRTRVVRLTERGKAALEVITDANDRLDREWAAALGEETRAELGRALARLEDVLDRQMGRSA